MGTATNSVVSELMSSKESKPSLSGSKHSLDLDELFGFSAARKRLQEPEPEVIEEPTYLPYRVFINNVDDFNSKHISNFLSDQVCGGTQPEGEEQEEMEEEEEETAEEEQNEEDENQENEGKEKDAKVKKEKSVVEKHNYEIVGTSRDPNYVKSESVEVLITDTADRESFLPQIMKCGFVIYDITQDPRQISEATWALQAIEKELEKLQAKGPKAFKKLKEVRIFILISTIMTWALTKPIDPEDPELPFTEADNRKRKPHPNYKEHCILEKEVVAVGKKFPTKLETLVVCSGLTYGLEEDVLHFLFKMAWYNEQALPLLQPGDNLIPLIHVQDLTNLIHMLLETFPPKIKYLLAVEVTASSLKGITKAISKKLSTGTIKKVPKEEAFLYPEVTQQIYDMLTVNLNMEPVYIVENLELKWVSEQSFIENINQVVTEYKESRGLKPLKILIHGPPASGKTSLAKQLCEHYKLHYLSVKNVIEEAIQNLKDTIEKAKAKEKLQEEEEVHDEDDEEEEDEDEDENIPDNLEEVYELLGEVEANRAENEGRLDDQYVLRFFKERMLSHPLQNQGFVLDGFPKTLEQAKILFESQDEEEEVVEEEEGEGQVSKKIMPDYVVSLEATDEFLCERVMALPEKDVYGTHYMEEPMLRRLTEFRAINTDENTMLNYLDEMEVHPQLLSVMDEPSPSMSMTLKRVIDKIGKARNYGPTPQEQELLEKQEEARKKDLEMEELHNRQELERKLHEERLTKMEEWASLMDALREEEEERMAIEALPLRNYLMKYVFPTLTRGLIEVAQVRPLDPVDYLAEYLFRENPEGKMFHPEYAAVAEEFMYAVQQYQDSLVKTGVLTEGDLSKISIPPEDEQGG